MIIVFKIQYSLKSHSRQISIIYCYLVNRSISKVHHWYHVWVFRFSMRSSSRLLILIFSSLTRAIFCSMSFSSTFKTSSTSSSRLFFLSSLFLYFSSAVFSSVSFSSTFETSSFSLLSFLISTFSRHMTFLATFKASSTSSSRFIILNCVWRSSPITRSSISRFKAWDSILLTPWI